MGEGRTKCPVDHFELRLPALRARGAGFRKPLRSTLARKARPTPRALGERPDIEIRSNRDAFIASRATHASDSHHDEKFRSAESANPPRQCCRASQIPSCRAVIAIAPKNLPPLFVSPESRHSITIFVHRRPFPAGMRGPLLIPASCPFGAPPRDTATGTAGPALVPPTQSQSVRPSTFCARPENARRPPMKAVQTFAAMSFDPRQSFTVQTLVQMRLLAIFPGNAMRRA